MAGVGDYEQALKRSVNFKLSYGDFRILDIDALIDAKQAVGRERDLEAIRFLRAIKEQQHQQKN